MLRDELLRAKNDEIARCLLSRKRKLSELYFATVGSPNSSDATPQNDLYRQKETAFLDANDLTKGRVYNESTLPARPNFATVTPSSDKVPEAVDHLLTSSTANADTENHGPGHVERQQPPSAHEVGVRPAPVDAYSNGQSSPQKVPTAPYSSQSIKPIPPPHVQTPLSPAVTIKPADEVMNGVSPDSVGFEIPPKKPDVEAVNERPDSLSTSKNNANATSPSPRPQENGTAPNGSLVSIAAPSKPEDAASSPISSGPLSSHTSATERSPASSSTEWVTSMTDTNSSLKTQDRPSSVRDRAALVQHPVPSTPDEQLKMEAAISFQNAAENKTIGNVPVTDASIPQQPDEQTIKDKPPKPSDATPTVQDAEESLQVNAATPLEDTTLYKVENQESKAITPDIRKKTQSPGPMSDSQPERMTTRVSSGAIRHKSVSEILGETPKHLNKSDTERRSSESSRSGSIDLSDKRSGSLRIKDRNGRGKEKSKLSTVVFPKTKPPSPAKDRSVELTRHSLGTNGQGSEEDDYLFTLFQAKAHYPPRTMSLSNLLQTSHKTLTTSNHLLEYHEQMDCRTLKRIYQLQHSNRWALRQLQRSPEPVRSAAHWDIVLDHMRWMRIDFREERKWKIAAAKRCADWCAEYVASGDERRAMLRVPVRRQETQPEVTKTKLQTDLPTEDKMDTDSPHNHPTPDLIPSADNDSVSDGFNDEFQPDLDDGNVPAAIFSLGSEEFTFRMEKTMASENILGELPLYSPVQIKPEIQSPTFKTPPDEAWKTQLLPVSKYATGTIRFKDEGPPRKKSRYDYTDSDDDEDGDARIDLLLPEKNDVALFQQDFKHIRDRIHPNHSFRPPTEFLMPPLGFYETRQSSQWTYAEDDELRRLVREYSYNWSLISNSLGTRSKFTSGADRRTPWECFERWIGLEGLPTEIAKTPYFRAYSSRLEAAQRSVLAAQQQALQQQQQQTGNQGAPAPPTLIRRRTTQPVRVERKRSSRHLALLAGMRKLSQKREALLQKQQQAAHLASLRKLNESNQPRPPITTPSEFSRLKHERELKYQEKQEQYRQQILAHQRAALAQRVAQQHSQQASQNEVPGRNPTTLPNVSAPTLANPLSNGANGVPNNGPMNQSRPHPSMQMPNGLPPNGALAPGGMPLKMMPQPGLQQPISGRPGLPLQTSPDNSRIIREANRVQEQQRLVQSRQQQQHSFPGQQPFIPQAPHSSPNMNNPDPASQNNPALMTAFQAASGVGSPSFHASSLVPGVSTASPRPNHPNPNSLPNQQAMPTINSIQSSLQRHNPNMPQDQLNKMANDRLQMYQQQRMSQAAMNAAAGNIGTMPGNYQMPRDNNVQHVPQSNVPNGVNTMQNSQGQGYSPLMRAAQPNQPNQPNRMGMGSPAMNGMVLQQQNRSGTPQAHRPQTSQGGGGAPGQTPGKSPRPPPAQMATG